MGLIIMGLINISALTVKIQYRPLLSTSDLSKLIILLLKFKFLLNYVYYFEKVFINFLVKLQ